MTREVAGQGGFVRAVAANARQRELQRQLRYNKLRRAAAQPKGLLASKVPPLLDEYVRASLTASIGCWVIGLLLSATPGIHPLYTFASLGLVYSSQSTYHKYRLANDPHYKVPRCKCASRRHDDSEKVLRSRASTIAGVPNSLLGALVYAAAIVFVAMGHTIMLVPLAALAVLTSVYLAHAMVFKIGGLCSTCVTLGALNLLVLLYAAL